MPPNGEKRPRWLMGCKCGVRVEASRNPREHAISFDRDAGLQRSCSTVAIGKMRNRSTSGRIRKWEQEAEQERQSLVLIQSEPKKLQLGEQRTSCLRENCLREPPSWGQSKRPSDPPAEDAIPAVQTTCAARTRLSASLGNVQKPFPAWSGNRPPSVQQV